MKLVAKQRNLIKPIVPAGMITACKRTCRWRQVSPVPKPRHLMSFWLKARPLQSPTSIVRCGMVAVRCMIALWLPAQP